MNRAFSLVELSIVLVILGLLVGGIMAGQSLIRAGELRKTIADIDMIRTATRTFRDKYFAIPGDMTNATSFWGAADGNDGLGTDCYAATPSGTATCNGDGDGRIGSTGTALPTGPESYRFWQHLVNAGLYPGNYTGIPGTPNYTAYYNDVIGTNIPRSAINAKAGYSVVYWWSNLAYASYKKQNTLTIAPCCWTDGSSRMSLEGTAVPSADMWNMDTKMDDGMPGYGNVQVYAPYGGILSASAYDLAISTAACQALIGLGF